ncbi:MAG: hypothetical protein KKD21_13535 [Proteobacteria bacterium]|nr:hypothetical protein [Pseudomonadota bacterium]
MAKGKEASPMEKARKAIQVPIKWNIPETIITRFASNMVVQNIEGFFKLSFFEIKPEIDLVAPATPPSEIVADCVGSMIVSPDKLRAIIVALTNQLNKYEAAITAQGKTDASAESKLLS